MTLNPFFDLNSFPFELHKKYYVFCKIVSYHQTIKAMSRSSLAMWRSSKTRHGPRRKHVFFVDVANLQHEIIIHPS